MPPARKGSVLRFLHSLIKRGLYLGSTGQGRPAFCPVGEWEKRTQHWAWAQRSRERAALGQTAPLGDGASSEGCAICFVWFLLDGGSNLESSPAQRGLFWESSRASSMSIVCWRFRRRCCDSAGSSHTVLLAFPSLSPQRKRHFQGLTLLVLVIMGRHRPQRVCAVGWVQQVLPVQHSRPRLIPLLSRCIRRGGAGQEGTGVPCFHHKYG